jgi:hypothetical protein
MSAASRTSRTAELNDALRSKAGLPLPAGNGRLKGLIVITRGICELPFQKQAEILARVRNFDAFNEGCDPYGEHDFGAFDIDGVGKVFFKLDYFSDERLEYGSEDPSDPEKSFRVLTIMLAEEY